MSVKVRLEFVIQDPWVGVYWRRGYRYAAADPPSRVEKLDIWVCLLPTLPIHLTLEWWAKAEPTPGPA